MPRQKLSKRMNNYLDDLHKAEFGYSYGHEVLYPKPNPERVVSLLEKALLWSKYDNLEALAIYLGYETDNRIETREGCKKIIRENINAWRNQ